MANQITELKRRFTGENGNQTVLIVGDGFVASSLARTLDGTVDPLVVTDSPGVARHAVGREVTLVLESPDEERALDGVSVVEGDLASCRTLRRAGADEATAGVVAIQRDEGAMLATRLLEATFDVGDVVTLLDDPRIENLTDGVETVCTSETVASQVESLLDELIVVSSR